MSRASQRTSQEVTAAVTSALTASHTNSFTTTKINTNINNINSSYNSFTSGEHLRHGQDPVALSDASEDSDWGDSVFTTTSESEVRMGSLGAPSYGPTEGLNLVESCICLFKSIMGLGIFLLPSIFVDCGLIGGLSSLILLSFISIYLNRNALEVKRYCSKLSTTFPDLSLAAFGKPGYYITFLALLISNISIGSIYLFTISQILLTLHPPTDFYGLLLLMVGPVILLTWVPSFRIITWTSLLGTLFLGVSLISFLISASHLRPLQLPLQSFNMSQCSQSFPTINFLLLQPSTLFPLSNNSREPSSFRRATLFVYILVAFISILFSTFMYAYFGNDTKGFILDNISNCQTDLCESLLLCARVGLIGSMVFGYPYFVFPITESFEMKFSRSAAGSRFPVFCKFMIARTIVVVLSMGIVIVLKLINKETEMISLALGISLGLQCFILIPILHVWVRRAEFSTNSLYMIGLYVLNGLVGVIGLLIGGTTLYWNIYSFTCKEADYFSC